MIQCAERQDAERFIASGNKRGNRADRAVAAAGNNSLRAVAHGSPGVPQQFSAATSYEDVGVNPNRLKQLGKLRRHATLVVRAGAGIDDDIHSRLLMNLFSK